MNRTARNYLNAVKRKIPMRDMRSRVMETVRPICEAYANEHPEADRTAYYERFGTPERIAKDALENTDADIIYRGLTRARRIWIVALIAAVLIVIGFGITYAYFCREIYASAGSYYGEESLSIIVKEGDDPYDE